MFGEIINHTAEEDFEPAEVKIVTGEKDEQLSDDEVEENSQISEHEIADDTDAVAETSDEQTEDSENVVTVDSSVKLPKMKKLILKMLKQISAHIAK